MTKNKEKQNHKTSDEMQHGVQPPGQHIAVERLAIASKCDMMIGIERRRNEHRAASNFLETL
jgi:hypothetical protein